MRLYFYLHTHWDREWYWNFGSYRSALIEVIDRICSQLENNEISTFMLDGQTSLLADAFEIKPELKERVKKLALSGKLTVGPWFVLADQLLVGGESLIRNFALGLAESREYGGATRVGYCPDTFGHSYDLPRILKGFGIDNAVVWRGVPPLPEGGNGPVFNWRSADGSEVLALQLNRGYYQTGFHEGVDPPALAAYLKKFTEADGLASGVIEPLDAVLVPVGGDHILPPNNFSAQLSAALKQLGKDYTGEEITLAAFMQKLTDPEMRAELEPIFMVQDELRDNRAAKINERAYLLDGVLSTRLYLKRDNRIAERRLVSVAEPLSALLWLQGYAPYPTQELDHCWRTLLLNHPHDSICGCSIDSVHREMQVRTESLHASMTTMLRKGQEAFCQGNLNAAEGERLPRYALSNTKILDPTFNNSSLAVFNGSNLSHNQVLEIEMATETEEPLLPEGGISSCRALQVTSVRRSMEAFTSIGGVPVFKNVSRYSGYLPVSQLQPFALNMYSPSQIPRLTVDKRSVPSSTEAAIENEFFQVKFKLDDLFVKAKIGGQNYKLEHRFILRSDCGDTYTFDPVYLQPVRQGKLIEKKVGLKGPLVSSILATYEISIPEKVEQDGWLKRFPNESDVPADTARIPNFVASKKEIVHKIQCEIFLTAGSPIIKFRTEFFNQCADFRLEVVFQVAKMENSHAENHFSVISRPTGDKSFWRVPHAVMPAMVGEELPPHRFPCQRFVRSEQEVIFNTGLTEFGVGIGKFFMTIVRAVSILSRTRMYSRGGGAGPHIATPEANCLGLNISEYGWAPLDAVTWLGLANVSEEPDARAYLLADLYEGQGKLEPFLLPSTYDELSKLSISQPMLTVGGKAGEIIVTAIYKAGDDLIVRLLNTTNSSKKVDLTLGFAASSAYICDLALTDKKELLLNPASACGLGLLPGVTFGAHELVTVKIRAQGK